MNACPHCDETHPHGTTFCPRTGQKLDAAVKCSKCGNPIASDWKVCAFCGHPVSLEEVPGQQSRVRARSSVGVVAGISAGLLLLFILVLGGFFLAGRRDPASIGDGQYADARATEPGGSSNSASAESSPFTQAPLVTGSDENGPSEAVGLNHPGDEWVHIGAPTHPQDLAAITKDNLDRLEWIGTIGMGEIKAAQFSADGSKLVILSSAGLVVYETGGFSKLYSLLAPRGVSLLSLAVSPAGGRIAVGTDHLLFIFGIDSGQLLSTLEAPGEYVYGIEGLTFSPDGNLLLGYLDLFDAYEIVTWNIPETRTIATFKLEEVSVSNVGICFSPDGALFALVEHVAGNSGNVTSNVQFWRQDNTGEWVVGESLSVFGISIDCAFSADGSRFSISTAPASGPISLPVLNPLTGENPLSLLRTDQSREYRNVLYAPDGRHLVSISTNAVIQQWDLSSGLLVREISTDAVDGQASYLGGVMAISPSGDQLFIGGIDFKGQVWNLSTSERIAELDEYYEGVVKIYWSDNGNGLIVVGEGRVIIWDLGSGQVEAQYDILQERVMTSSEDGRLLAFKTRLAGVNVIDSTTGNLLYDFPGITTAESGGIAQLLFSGDNEELFAGTDKGSLIQIRLATGETSSQQVLPAGELIAMGINETGAVLMLDNLGGFSFVSTAGIDRRILAEEVPASIWSSFSPDGNYFQHLTVESPQVWDLHNAELLYQLPIGIPSISFAPDSSFIAAYYSWMMVDQELREVNGFYFFDTKTGELLQTMDVPLFLSSLLSTFSPSGRHLAIHGNGGAILLFGVQD